MHLSRERTLVSFCTCNTGPRARACPQSYHEAEEQPQVEDGARGGPRRPAPPSSSLRGACSSPPSSWALETKRGPASPHLDGGVGGRGEETEFSSHSQPARHAVCLADGGTHLSRPSSEALREQAVTQLGLASLWGCQGRLHQPGTREARSEGARRGRRGSNAEIRGAFPGSLRSKGEGVLRLGCAPTLAPGEHWRPPKPASDGRDLF